MSWLTRIAIKKTWITYLIAAIVTGVSVWSMTTLKMELIPDIEFPMTTIVTVYPQAQTEDVMNKVTIPVENAIADIEGLKHITSTSRENTSIVFAEFEYGMDMDKINKSITDCISLVDLPAEIRALPSMMPQLDNNPQIIPLNINMLPLVTFNLAGDIPISQLNLIAQEQVVPLLNQVDGVYDVSISGGESDIILVTPSLEKLNEMGISTGQLAAALSMQEFNSVNAVENAFLSPVGPQLNQIASVVYGPIPGAAINRANGKPCIEISVSKYPDENTVTTANKVINKLDDIKGSLPAGVEIYTMLDQSDYIERSIRDLTTNALLGAGLAVVVVFIFLMAFGASLITAVSIPLSVLLSFFLMRITNITINILTLSAIIIAVGQVIDNSIVILEVTYRRLQTGEKFKDAAINGVKEVVKPITSTTIATVVIFIPLALVGGMIGEVFIPFALTISYAILGSLLIALTVVPSLSKLLTIKTDKINTKTPKYQKVYTNILKWCLSHRGLTLLIAIILFIGGISLIPVIGTSFMPELNISVITTEIEMPEESSQAELMDVVSQVEELLSQNSNIENYSTSIGSSLSLSSGIVSVMGGSSTTGNVAEITINIRSTVDPDDVTEQLQTEFSQINTSGNIKVSAMSAMVASSTTTVQIAVRGDNLQDISDVADQLSGRISNINGISEPVVTVAGTSPTLIITPDLIKLTAAGATTSQIDNLQKEFILLKQGGTVATATIDDAIYDIMISGVIQQTTDLDTLKSIPLGSLNSVPLGEIADISIVSQPDEISRTDQKMAASITATITQKNVGAVNRSIQDEIDSMTLPAGVEISTGGVTEEMQESFVDMFRSIIIAIALVYIVLVIAYRSFRNPLIILASLPLASIGAFLGLLFTGHTLGVIGLMGMLQLVSIVLANAVLLLAYVGQLRKEGKSVNDALITGGQIRLRPILMTAITTMIAILPLAFGLGEGVIMAAEMAVVVVGGLFSSTLLTLLVVPVIYSLVYDRRRQSPDTK